MGDFTTFYNLNDLHDGPAKLASTNQKLDEEVRQLLIDAQAVLESWSSPNHDLYTEYQTRFNNDMQKMNEILGGPATKSLVTATDNYTTNEAQNRQLWT